VSSSWATRNERRAFVCLACLKAGAPTRVFLHPGEPEPPRCTIHRCKMVRQVNKRYHHK
jgi:hypothetical protein